MKKDVLAKKKAKEQQRLYEKQLRKEFEMHPYLSINALEEVKRLMERFQGVCKM